jgi:2'-5' RNA ligase
MANWFVALPVSPEGWLAERVPAPPAAFRAFPPQDLHLTVAFLGSTGEDAARRGWAALRWPLPAQRVSCGAVVPMGGRPRYSALSVTLVHGRREVEAAMTQARGPVWQAAGARPDDRPANAHFTLARPGRGASQAERAAGLRWARSLDLSGVEIVLDRVALYTWSEDRPRRLFRIVEELRLGGGSFDEPAP